ncbi:arylphorin subunit beta-like [Lutzomyia longipalpis]|uniref:arylphorin subunit beta-like n=1 Tax=Lutzomyia longipalpis TaxID=7200 RepID=UPI0024841600|nr:arylphorin subunit beta-like [Lutzomyia longipalpis]
MLPLRGELCAILLLTCATLLNGAYWMGGTSPTSEIHKCTSDFVVNQKKIYALFRHIFSPTWNPVLTRTAKEFNVTDMTRYKDEKFPKVVMDFGKSMMKGRIKPVAKTYPFVYHLEPCVREFHTTLGFYKHIKDFDGVLESAAWLRNITNEESFMYSLLTYLIHHAEEEFLLPPPYEINPYKFFRDDVIRTAHLAKMSSCDGANFADENGIMVKYIDYDGPVSDGWEGDLAYFREDIDLNAYYYLFKLSFESSLEEEYFENTTRGEIFLYEHQQLLARYNLERFALDFDPVEAIPLFEETMSGYYPLMSHANGFPLIPRPYFYEEILEDSTKMDVIREEQGMLQLIDLGGIWHPGGKLDFKRPGGLNFLGSMIEGNTENKSNFPKFWPLLLKLVSGPKRYRTRKDQMDFSNVFDHHETQLRDPAYFQAIQRVMNLIRRHQDHLPPYDFEAKFIDVVDVKVSELQTMFEKRSVDISNAVAMEPVHDVDAEEWLRDEDVRFKVNLKVLTHIPFYYDLKVHADNPTDAVVRVFLGPNDAGAERIDLYNWDENRQNFFQIDYYPVKLHRGDNKITRKSTTFTGFGSGFKSFEEMSSMDDDESFTVSSRQSFCAFPERLMLPKSTTGGEDFVLYFVVTPTEVDVNEIEPTRLCAVGKPSRWADNWPMGFPFDRKINNEDFLVKNSAAKRVTIYHSEE